MPGNSESQEGLVVLLFTRFPVLSETFLQREVACFKETGLPMRLVSLWKGEPSWNGVPVETRSFWQVCLSLLWLPLWLVRKPRETASLLGAVWHPRRSGWLNWVENLLGLGYALQSADRWRHSRVSHIHAVWASAPAAAAWGLHTLTGIPFSFSGHAYDLFERGGDGWIREKLSGSAWVRTSTQAGVRRFLDLGAHQESIIHAGRGLMRFPEFDARRPLSQPLRILSVGRMVEKMGYDRQIPVFKDLSHAGYPYQVTWIGDGPERPRLEQLVREAGLEERIRFEGAQPYDSVESAYRTHDILLFTGRVDRRGDRAGLPNAVAEAMAWGLPVFATAVGAIPEVLQNGINAVVWSGEPDGDTLLRSLGDMDKLWMMQSAAREWTLAHYDVRKNLRPVLLRLGMDPANCE